MSKNEELRKGISLFLGPYLKSYRERVNALYSEEHANSNIFTYMKPISLYVLLRDKDTHLLFIEGEKDELRFIDCNENSNFQQISSRSEKLVKMFITELTGIDDYLAVFPYYNLGEFGSVAFSEANRGNLQKRAERWGANKADSDYDSYGLVKAIEKATTPLTTLSVVDTDEILKNVQDPSFQYEFGESAKAYNAGLYLAAASTAGIALENILRLIIVKKVGKGKLPSQTYIRHSLTVLEKEQILPGRLLNETRAQNWVRNSSSHTNEDPIKKETVDTLFRVIDELSFFVT